MKKRSVVFLLTAALALQIFTVNSFAIHSVIRVGFCQNFAPYQFLDKTGKPSGFHIDLIDTAGWDAYTSVEYTAFATDRECIHALEAGEIDAALGVSKSSAFNHNVALTDVLSSSNLCLIASNEIAAQIAQNNSTVGLTASVESGQLSRVLSLHQIQNGAGFGNNTFICVSSQKGAIDYLVEKKADFAICEKNSALYLLKEYGCQNDYTLVYNYLTGLDFYMAVRADDQSVLLRMNSVLSNSRVTGQYSRLLEKWIVSEEFYVLKRVRTIAISIAAAAAIVVSAYYLVNRRIRLVLQDRIDKQTCALQNINNKLTRNLRLLEAESSIRARIIEDSPSGMLMFSDSGKILLINKKACELLSVSQNICASFDIHQIPPLNDILGQIDRHSQQPTVVSCHKDDTPMLLRCIIYQIPGDERDTWLLSFEDVTQEERNKQEQIEMEKSRILNSIVAGISHEIKNPLMAIKTYSSVVAEQKNNPEFMESFARYVPSEVERINKLVNSLLNYARPEKGIMTRICIMTMLNECVALLDSFTKKSGADITCDGDESVSLLVYQDGLRQAIVNYLINAIDSVSAKSYENNERGKISVCCEQQSKKCIISILDNGVGMTEKQLQRCAEPFYTTKAKGTGLGMSIASQKVKENGGTVTIDSKLGCYTKIIMEFEVMQ